MEPTEQELSEYNTPSDRILGATQREIEASGIPLHIPDLFPEVTQNGKMLEGLQAALSNIK